MARVEKGYRMAIVRSRDPLTLEVVPDVTVVSFQAAEALVRNQGVAAVEYMAMKLAKGGETLMVEIKEKRVLRS